MFTDIIKLINGFYQFTKDGIRYGVGVCENNTEEDNALLAEIEAYVEANPDEVTYEQPYVPTLEEVKTQKIFELNAKSSEAILGGFFYNNLHWSYDTFDQLNFESTFNGLTIYTSQGLEIPTIVWNAYTDETHTELVTQQLDGTSFTMLYSMGALKHKQDTMAKTGILKQQVYDATTVEEVNAIIWE